MFAARQAPRHALMRTGACDDEHQPLPSGPRAVRDFFACTVTGPTIGRIGVGFVFIFVLPQFCVLLVDRPGLDYIDSYVCKRRSTDIAERVLQDKLRQISGRITWLENS
jgi:hypothetical protein